MKHYSSLLIAPVFLFASVQMLAQKKDTITSKQVDEVIIIGYGKQKKTDLTGSVTSISSKDFIEGSVTSPEQLVQGKTAGVQIVNNGGAPGSGSTIRIRGGNSLNASNDPLIVIDGVPVDNNGINGASNPLALINPNDIESFSILKDASATAIYGSRASGGVIIINTKKGNSGKLRVNFSSNVSVSTKMGNIDVLTAAQFKNVVMQNATTGYQSLLGNDTTNWQNQIYRSAIGNDNSLSLSGGIKKLPYRLSLGYLNQDGLLINNNFKRSTLGFNLSPKFLDNHISLNLNYKGIYSENDFADGGAIGSALNFDPTKPVFNPNMPTMGGYWEWLQNDGNPIPTATKNPVSMLNQRIDRSYVSRHIGNVQLDYKLHFLPDLRFNLNLGLDNSSSNGFTETPQTLASSFTRLGTKRSFTQEKTNKLLDFYTNYVKTFGKSNLDATVGYSYQDFTRNDPFFATKLGTGQSDPTSGRDFFTQNTILGYFGRLNYAYDGKYLLTATYRLDKSSRFSKENRSATFPSIALAWRLDQENFMKDNKFFNELKLRLGWGKTGQQEINNGDYPYLARYVQGDGGTQYPIGEFNITYRPQGYDPNIKWETTTSQNIGFDFGILKNRISGSFDYFVKDTKDLLSLVPVPAGANLTNQIITNVGDMQNKGFEIALNVKALQKENLKWEFSTNLTRYKNEITNLSKTSNPNQYVQVGGISGGTGNMIQIHSVGVQPNTFYVYQQVYDTNGKPIEGVYVDRNGDGVINDKDLYKYKSPAPDFLIGFSSKLTYKQFDFGFSLRASIGNYVYNNTASNSGNLAGISNNNFLSNLHSDYLTTNFKRGQYFSDYYVENASFLRMDNINVGYNLSNVLSNIAKVRVFATAQNVFIITKYKGLDPEVFNGIDNNLYQRPKVYSLGFNVQF